MFDVGALVRPALRATVGKSLDLREKLERADKANAIAELINLRAERRDRLANSDYVVVGEEHGVEPWKLHAMVDMESSKGGYDNDGRLIAMPELHKFSAFTGHFYDETNPELSIPKWIPPAKVKAGHPYRLGNRDRWDIIARQCELNFDAAIRATTMGAFQILIDNYKSLNFDTPMGLVRYINQGERWQLDIAVRYLIAFDGLDPLINGDYVNATKVQNGTGQVQKYAAEWKERAQVRQREYA